MRKKKLLSVLLAVSMLTSLLPGAAAAATRGAQGAPVSMLLGDGADVTVESIEIKTPPTKTSYHVGNYVSLAGMVIEATLSDGTKQTVTSGFTCDYSETPLDKVNNAFPVTVTYEGKTATFNVTVEPAVTGITIKTSPAKLNYLRGQSLVTTGMVLTVAMANSTTKDVSSGYTCSPTELSTNGTQAITVTYSGKTATFNVTVTEPAVNSISIRTLPTTRSYIKGQSLDPTGMVLSVSLSSGKTETVTEGYTCSPTKLSSTGTQVVTVTYKGKTTTFTVSVVEPSVSGLVLKTKPTTLDFYRGDTLVTTGMVLTAIMTDGTTKDISSGYTCSPTELTSNGKKTITVTYGGHSVTYTVNVTEPVVSSIAVKTKPTVVNYYQGDYLQSAGLTLTATLANKSTRVITSGFICTPTHLKAGGTQTITVTYGGQSTTFTVNVTPKKANAAFVDILANQWFYSYVDELTKRGILSGIDNHDGTYSFRPYSNVTRAEFVAMLARASGLDGGYHYSRFTDVPYSNWACSYITWASVNGIVTGSGGLFRPNDYITRQEMAVMLTRYSVYLGKPMGMDVLPVKFTDDAYIADWARNSVFAMQKAGIITGSLNANGSYSFRPLAAANRAEAAKVIAAYLIKQKNM